MYSSARVISKWVVVYNRNLLTLLELLFQCNVAGERESLQKVVVVCVLEESDRGKDEYDDHAEGSNPKSSHTGGIRARQSVS